MAKSSQTNCEGNFESLNLMEFHKLFQQESGPWAEKYSMATHSFTGGVTEWCTGFIFQKVGKLAATVLANHTGYIKKDIEKAKDNQIPSEVRNKAEEVVSFVKKNVLVTGGFFGGFLLCMAS
uniref:FUN14 domain-containing protein 2 n=1 Tax=Saimiri boliviensis boliviensis TaxID=39432 RepID=A0A2K6T6A0_SAIBB